ncbi:MFS transporter [Arthroderma uncinatum]|uniref:MFS transporter n=1 Tax=Arthroderma uncinatum TaxID=74035 RepID=UPI00144AEFFE|nr:MFS transporter [Arthroderma uncinatum]KAF3483761.1 MFS transporter [Arthroderma uncinatum]
MAVYRRTLRAATWTNVRLKQDIPDIRHVMKLVHEELGMAPNGRLLNEEGNTVISKENEPKWESYTSALKGCKTEFNEIEAELRRSEVVLKKVNSGIKENATKARAVIAELNSTIGEYTAKSVNSETLTEEAQTRLREFNVLLERAQGILEDNEATLLSTETLLEAIKIGLEGIGYADIEIKPIKNQPVKQMSTPSFVTNGYLYLQALFNKCCQIASQVRNGEYIQDDYKSKDINGIIGDLECIKYIEESGWPGISEHKKDFFGLYGISFDEASKGLLKFPPEALKTFNMLASVRALPFWRPPGPQTRQVIEDLATGIIDDLLSAQQDDLSTVFKEGITAKKFSQLTSTFEVSHHDGPFGMDEHTRLLQASGNSGPTSANASTGNDNDDARRSGQAWYLKFHDTNWLAEVYSVWKVPILVYAFALLVDIADTVRVTPKTQLFETIICYGYCPPHGLNSTSLDISEDPCKSSEVQGDLVAIKARLKVIENIFALMLAIPFGNLANKRGRVFVLVLGTIGQILSEIWILIVSLMGGGWLPFNSIYLSSILKSAGGGGMVLSAIGYTILSDVLPSDRRAQAFFYMASVQLITEVIAPVLGSVLMQAWSVYAPLVAGLVFELVGFVVLSMIPDTSKLATQEGDISDDDETIREHGDLKPEKYSILASIKTGIKHALAPFVLVWTIVSGSLDIFFVTISFLVATLGREILEFLIQYTSKRFSWSLAESGRQPRSLPYRTPSPDQVSEPLSAYGASTNGLMDCSRKFDIRHYRALDDGSFSFAWIDDLVLVFTHVQFNMTCNT